MRPHPWHPIDRTAGQVRPGRVPRPGKPGIAAACAPLASRGRVAESVLCQLGSGVVLVL